MKDKIIICVFSICFFLLLLGLILARNDIFGKDVKMIVGYGVVIFSILYAAFVIIGAICVKIKEFIIDIRKNRRK